MSDDLFANNFEYDPNKNYVEDLVGEGKKFSDQNKLAYSALEKDRFIERLKTENESMRKEITTSQRLEELVTKLQNPVTTQPASNDNNQDNHERGTQPPTNVGLTPEQAEELVMTKLREKENYDKSLNGLKKSFGQDYQPKLDAEAKRLGMSPQEVNTLAKANPELFLRIFSQETRSDGTNILPDSSLNTTSMQNRNTNGLRTKKYYDDLKLKDPKTYWSKAIQQQEYQDAMKLGEAFFS